MAQEQRMAQEQNVLANGVKLLGEVTVTPGAGLLLDGKIGYGLLHAGLAVAATVTLGPVGAVIARGLLAVNSYSNSVNNVGLLDIGKAAVNGVAQSDTSKAETQSKKP